MDQSSFSSSFFSLSLNHALLSVKYLLLIIPLKGMNPAIAVSPQGTFTELKVGFPLRSLVRKRASTSTWMFICNIRA